MDTDSLTVPRFIWVLISATLLVSIAAGLTYLARQMPYVVRLERVEEPKQSDRVDTSERVNVERTPVPFVGVPVPHVTTNPTPAPAVVPAPVNKRKVTPQSSVRRTLQSKWGRGVTKPKPSTNAFEDLFKGIK